MQMKDGMLIRNLPVAVELIEGAIQRLIDGEYGKCQECGEPISEGRLAIRPYAVFCVKCKSRHEKEQL